MTRATSAAPEQDARSPAWALLRLVAGVVAGYALMVAGITAGFAVLGDPVWGESSFGHLLATGACAFLAAALGAALAVLVAGARRRWLPAAAMMVLVALETTALALRGDLSGPLWLDLLGAGNLWAGLAAGALAAALLAHRRGAA